MIKYTKQDDLAIEKYIKQSIATAYHSISTCPMRPRAEGGVVDPRLNVYGVRNLKIAGELRKGRFRLAADRRPVDSAQECRD